MRLIRLAHWGLAAVALSGCQDAAGPPDDVEPATGVDRIDLSDNTFEPRVVAVPAGSTVTWAFTDGGRSHNVVGDDFESDVSSDGTFTHTFTDPGTYDYECTLHSGMNGRIIVTDA